MRFAELMTTHLGPHQWPHPADCGVWVPASGESFCFPHPIPSLSFKPFSPSQPTLVLATTLSYHPTLPISTRFSWGPEASLPISPSCLDGSPLVMGASEPRRRPQGCHCHATPSAPSRTTHSTAHTSPMHAAPPSCVLSSGRVQAQARS